MRLALVCLLVACKGDPPAPAPSASLAKLTVTVDGAPLAIDRAFITRASPDVYTVLLGAGKGSCEALRTGALPGEGTAIGFTVTKRVAATGAERFVITGLWSRDFVAKAPGPVEVELAGTADPKTKTRLALAFDGPVAIRGELEAVGCGAVTPGGLGTPKVTHPSKGTLVVAGKRLPIRGVTVRVRPGVAATDLPNITISTNLADCSGVTLPAPVILERADTKWSLRGTWFEQPIENVVAPALGFTANSVGTSPDGPTLELQLVGTGKLGDYTVELAGTAEAIECVR